MDSVVWFGIAAAASVTFFLVWVLQGGRYLAGEQPECADGPLAPRR